MDVLAIAANVAWDVFGRDLGHQWTPDYVTLPGYGLSLDVTFFMHSNGDWAWQAEMAYRTSGVVSAERVVV